MLKHSLLSLSVLAATLGTAAGQSAQRLGEGDTVTVSVLGRDDFNETARIGEDGSIRLPLIGVVAAEDMTPLELAKKVEGELRGQGYFANPVVDVDVQAVESRTVTVLGNVSNPGLVSFDRTYRLSEILARVGGVAPGAADHVVLSRADGSSVTLDIALIASGGVAADPEISPGDKVFVPEAELFYIYGEVNAPGEYPLSTGATLRMALANGGGLTPLGSKRRIKLVRGDVEMKKVRLETEIEPGDVIVVGERLF